MKTQIESNNFKMTTVTIQNTKRMTEQKIVRSSMDYSPLRPVRNTYIYQDPINYLATIPLKKPLNTKSYKLTISYPLLYSIFAAEKTAIKQTEMVYDKVKGEDLIDITAYTQRSVEDIEEAMYNEGLFCFHDVLAVADMMNDEGPGKTNAVQAV